MRKYGLFFVCGPILLFGLGACRSTVTTPTVPKASDFKITDFQFSVQYWNIGGEAFGTYANATKADAAAAGTVDWGDGQKTNLSGIPLPKSSSSSWSISIAHAYAAAGVYTVTINLTAPFSDGPISAGLTKTVVVNQ
jgi:hypothetical protein